MVDTEAGISYLVIEWRHDNAEDPTTLYSELDPERREVRKVEVYADGRLDLADASRSTGTTWLGEGVTPSVDEINSLGPFDAKVIAKDEFERVWARACSRHALDQGG